MAKKKSIAPWTRVVILVVALLAALGVAKFTTGTFIPAQPADALIFQNALLLVVLGSAILEHRFTKPADSVVNGLMGVVTLVTVYDIANPSTWWPVAGYCIAVFAVGAVCTVASTGPKVKGWRRKIASATYRPAVVFGRARVLFSIVFLYAVFTFYGIQSPRTGILVVFWGVFIAIWPLRIPELLTAITKPAAPKQEPVGTVVRTDWPDLVRVELTDPDRWRLDAIFLYAHADGSCRPVLPLYVQAHATAVLGTGLCGPVIDAAAGSYGVGMVFDPPDGLTVSRSSVLGDQADDGEHGDILGFVVEDSSVGEIRFETWAGSECYEGRLVWCRVGAEVVHYQVTAGTTREETFSGDRHGFQVATASQLGIISSEKGFRKFPWLPAMNTPVFGAPHDFGKDLERAHDTDFQWGVVPGTSLAVSGPFVENMEYHTALLGVTGSGKTELAFDLLRAAAAAGVKVICIDITAKYENRLADLDADNLSITAETSALLSERLFAVETGTYGAPAEKRALNELAEQLRDEVSSRVRRFLVGEDASQVGIITLDEISNTKATIFITELFLTSLLHFAKDHPDGCPRVLVVVEEAHTVIPEASTMGLGDFESRGLVGKISQVALQGRKYGVGLLVIAQRTATVSKTVLTQCNTMITFNTFDETSLGFLRNIYGRTHTELISNLLPLQAVIFGKGIRAERPIMVQIPFVQAKADLGS